MTVWTPFPCELERCFYDLELQDGHRIRHIWPLKEEGRADAFYSYQAGVVPPCLIARVRVFDETNKD